MRFSVRVAAWLVVPLLAQYPGEAGAAPPSHRVVKGALTAAGETWVAGEAGAVVELGDGVVLYLVPGSRLRQRPAVSLPLGVPPGRGPTPSFSSRARLR